MASLFAIAPGNRYQHVNGEKPESPEGEKREGPRSGAYLINFDYVYNIHRRRTTEIVALVEGKTDSRRWGSKKAYTLETSSLKPLEGGKG